MTLSVDRQCNEFVYQIPNCFSLYWAFDSNKSIRKRSTALPFIASLYTNVDIRICVVCITREPSWRLFVYRKNKDITNQPLDNIYKLIASLLFNRMCRPIFRSLCTKRTQHTNAMPMEWQWHSGGKQRTSNFLFIPLLNYYITLK